MRLKGKVILITGGSGGIGSTTAVECAKEGAQAVYLTYFGSPEKAAAVVQRINGSGSTGTSIKVDVSRRSDAQALARQIIAKEGRIDGAVCYAGYPIDKGIWFGDFLNLSEEQLRKPLQVDVEGTVYTAQAILPFMLEKNRGSIVLVSSTPGLVGDVAGIPYALGKAANANLAKCLAQLYGARGVRANAIAPGSIATPANLAALAPKDFEALAAEASLRRFGTPEEVARMAVFLLSEDSSFITGQTLICDGGTVFR
jgi:NAD(P)-dependent dehydrogenase (short-subunit alcohol dehydrogenase family)